MNTMHNTPVITTVFTLVSVTFVGAVALAQSTPVAPLAAPTVASPVAPPVAGVPVAEARPMVELAICLDISGSMDGLIDSAKARLWSIVNDLATAKPVPRVRVALLTYGCDAYDSTMGWVVVDSGLTEDLDLISQKLFALKTNGGTELVGRVVNKAAQTLAWSSDSNALRMIIVAGNEAADQDLEVTYQQASRTSIERGVLVNSIYCGDANDSLASTWGNVARLADGQFFCIDQSMGALVAETPFDKQLAELSMSINATYLACGTKGEAAWANQSAQDANALGLSGGAAAQRAASKSSAIYDNRAWDLVDGCAAGEMKLEEMKDEDLPESMRGKTLGEKQAILATQQGERARIQQEIQALQVQREAFLTDVKRKAATTQGVSLDDALRQAIRTQATAKGFKFETPALPVPVAANTAAATTQTAAGQSKN